jgi:ABC-2 type transport system permease protein
MTMLRTLLAKDLRRIRRNPGPWIAMLMIPLLLTTLIGLAFGGGGKDGPPGKIKIAVVDEDDSVLSTFLRNAPRNDEAGDRLDIEFLPREEAMDRVMDGAVSAVMVVPKGFTDDLVAGRQTKPIEVVKNPAQGFAPALVEEGVGAMVTLLNAFARTSRPVLEELEPILTEGSDFLTSMATLASVAGRYEPARGYVFPWIFDVSSVTRDNPDKEDARPGFNLFAQLLVGMGAMFVLYISDIAMRGLYREVQIRTLERFRTLHGGLMVFISSKVVFSAVAAVIGSVIIFGSGPVVFQFQWSQPLALATLVLAYAVFAAGFMGLLTALGGGERKADVINNVVIMVVSIAGGAMIPIEQFPSFFREYIAPIVPTRWFVSAGRGLEFGTGPESWLPACAKLVAFGLVAMAISAAIFRRRLEKGVRA